MGEILCRNVRIKVIFIIKEALVTNSISLQEKLWVLKNIIINHVSLQTCTSKKEFFNKM